LNCLLLGGQLLHILDELHTKKLSFGSLNFQTTNRQVLEARVTAEEGSFDRN
jgi:hypothetical protein